MTAGAQPSVVVITDANVLINFFHIGQLSLLGKLAKYRFAVPMEVIAEVDEPAQATELAAAFEGGILEKLVIDDPITLGLFSELRSQMGRGEAACLAAAAIRKHLIASDEKKRFKRKTIELLGEGRLLRTEDLIICAIREGHVTVDEADGYKAILAANRYAMAFASFFDVL
jgi:predicted nucleic acid-binding protein